MEEIYKGLFIITKSFKIQFIVSKLSKHSGFCIININLIRLIFGSYVWAFKIQNVHIFGFSNVHTFEPFIILIRLM